MSPWAFGVWGAPSPSLPLILESQGDPVLGPRALTARGEVTRSWRRSGPWAPCAS